MTEAEWLAFVETEDVRAALRPLGTERKLRLFVAACLRECLHLLPNKDALYVISLNEQAAGLEDATIWTTTRGVIKHQEAFDSEPALVLYAAANPDAGWAAAGAAWHAAGLLASIATRRARTLSWSETYSEHRIQAQRGQYQLLCDVFGNRFQSVSPDPAWLTSDVLALSRGIYEEKAFDRMPILADALQDAGCANEDVLTHCRDPKQVHVRGCWVLDLLLCKG